MKHNQDKVEQAEACRPAIGVDPIRFIPVGLPFELRNRKQLAEEWFPTRSRAAAGAETPQTFGQADRPSPCYYLYRSMVVNADGGISPCCIVYRGSRDFDDLKQHETIDVGAIWNNEKFKSARSLYSAEEVPSGCARSATAAILLRGTRAKSPNAKSLAASCRHRWQGRVRVDNGRAWPSKMETS